MLLSAPVAADVPPRVGPDELFRAWQGSVREAAAEPVPWRTRARRPRGRQAAKVGVPAAVIVTVGVGALLMLTGRANDVLAERAAAGPVSSATPGFSASLSPVAATLTGYPGQHGTASTAALWSANGLTVAAGVADGHPAIWRRAPDGSWSLVSAATLGGLTGHLTAVSEGPAGWIAVGSVTVNGTAEPVAYQSPDGLTWTALPGATAFAGASAQFVGVTAGPGGYVVAGRAGSGTHTHIALWRSADLKTWTSGQVTTSAGSHAAAVVAVGNGFAAVGAELGCHTIWTSPDGRHWTAHDLAKPDGAQSATLVSVAAGPGGRIVAAGFAARNGASLPIVVTSADGEHFTQVVLSAPAPAAVTAVTAAGSGFVAVGQAGAGSGQHAVTWISSDGLTWTSASTLPDAGSGSGEVTADTDTGTSATGTQVVATARTGSATAVLAVPSA